jgi:hypothetical protein
MLSLAWQRRLPALFLQDCRLNHEYHAAEGGKTPVHCR